MLRHDALQGDGAALGVGDEVGCEDLCPGAGVGGVSPECQGRNKAVLARSDHQIDQDRPGRASVELAVVLTRVTPSHRGDLEVVVGRLLTVDH